MLQGWVWNDEAGSAEEEAMSEAKVRKLLKICDQENERLDRELRMERARRVNECAEVRRIQEWMVSDKPADMAFTEGPERALAYAIEVERQGWIARLDQIAAQCGRHDAPAEIHPVLRNILRLCKEGRR